MSESTPPGGAERVVTKRAGLAVSGLVACTLSASGVVAAEGHLHGTIEGKVYVSPVGGFRCTVPDYELGETHLEDEFESDGGTAKFKGFFNITRIDFQQLEDLENLPKMALSDVPRYLLAEYFDSALVPQVRSGVPGATVLSHQVETRPGEPYTLVSVMKLPKVGHQGQDMYRGAVQYTDEKSMYVVSVSFVPPPSHRPWSEAQNADDARKQAVDAFRNCTFPPSASGAGKAPRVDNSRGEAH